VRREQTSISASGGVAFASRHLLLETAVPDYARLVLVSGAMLVSYGAIVVVFSPAVADDLKRAYKRRSEGGLDG